KAGRRADSGCSGRRVAGFVRSLLFFFSSRRRHTRFSRDWSSDVCSSDLTSATPASDAPVLRRATEDPAYGVFLLLRIGFTVLPRSEERRVGKECRYRWWQENDNKKKTAEKVVANVLWSSNTASTQCVWRW